MTLQLINRAEINTSRWNDMISRYAAGLPYAFTYYLDLITEGKWMAVVSGDYDWVMPLPYNRKLGGLRQFYQPFFCQQLGIYGSIMPDINQQNELFTLLKKKAIRTHIALNELNNQIEHVPLKEKINLVLPLDEEYDHISKQYSEYQKRKIKKNKDYINIEVSHDFQLFCNLYHKYTLTKINSPIKKAWLNRYFSGIEKTKLANIIFATNEKNSIIAGLMYLQTPERIVALLPFSDTIYKEFSGQALIIDHLIRSNSEKSMVLDFEGSSIPGVARFYQSFGAISRNYKILSI